MYYFSGKAVLRRSSRLQSQSYYNSDGKPVISYKETPYKRVFKKRKSHFRIHKPPDTAPDTEPDTAPNKEPDTAPYTALKRTLTITISSSPTPSGGSGLITPDKIGPANRPWRALVLVLFLCFGVFWTLVGPPGFFTSTVKKVFTGSSEDEWKSLKQLQEELKELKEKMELLQPISDTMPNFALEVLGARIIDKMTSESYPTEDMSLTLFGFTVMSVKQPPLIGPSILLQGQAPVIPGQCWAFKGSKGQLTIELSHTIMVSHVTIGHISQNISPDEISLSAPRMFSVFGKRNMEDPKIYLGTFNYESSGRPLQTFEIAGRRRNMVKYLSLQVHNNWGNLCYTCIYSFRVHGKLALDELNTCIGIQNYASSCQDNIINTID